MIHWQQLAYVALGGGAGAVCRFVIGVKLQQRWPVAFPTGTLAVNVVGCLLLALLAEAVHAGHISASLRLLLATGFLGALTTFSTFGYETIVCYQQQGTGLALSNIAANLGLGLLAASLGILVGRWLWPLPLG